MNTNQHERATLYLADLWGYDRIEASDVTWRFEKYAQFSKAARVEYTVRGKRKRQTAMITTVPLVVLDGWGHPEPPPKFGPPERIGGQTMAQTYGVSLVTRSGRTSLMLFYMVILEGSKTRVLLDLRKHDPKTV